MHEIEENKLQKWSSSGQNRRKKTNLLKED